LLANPISEEFSIPKHEIDVAINQAVKEAAEQGFHGHANTPFILARIKDLTKGKSIPVNRALIQRNVEMAAKVAVELANFIRPKDSPERSTDISTMPMRDVRETMSKTQNVLDNLTTQLSVGIIQIWIVLHKGLSRKAASDYTTGSNFRQKPSRCTCTWLSSSRSFLRLRAKRKKPRGHGKL